MSSRRLFLQSVLFLPSLVSAQAFAQDKTASSVSFADFEGVSWNDWTTEGDAFGTRPATDALFPGKISGFNGRGFVCTLHPRKGNAATGKAVSREFVIEKSFITFKIGGGNFPGQACLNLVVDGKTERTATGDGTANLSEKTWDVSALVGKKALLEIVDNTVSDQRGYVLVDDITFNARPAERGIRDIQHTFLNNEQKTAPISNEFIYYCRSIVARSNIKSIDCYRDFGVRVDEMYAVMSQVGQEMVDTKLDHSPSRSALALASLIKTQTTKVSENFIQDYCQRTTQLQISNVLFFLQFYGYHEWVRTHVLYDAAILEGRKDFYADGDSLKQEHPATVCGGYSWSVVRLATLGGLKGVFKVECASNKTSSTIDHSYNIAKLPSGATLFASPSDARLGLSYARQRKGITFSAFSPSIEDWPVGMYLLVLHSSNLIEGYIKGQDVDAKYVVSSDKTKLTTATDIFTKLPWDQWSKWEIPKSLWPVWNFFHSDMLTATTDTTKNL